MSLVLGRPGCAAPPRKRGGFSLVELLVAASLASALLAAAWGWVWTTSSAARRTDAVAQGATAQAFAARMLRADLAVCVGLCPPDLGVCGPTALALLVRDVQTGDERVVKVAWDPGRRVLWRNAAGSYLAEGVASFSVRYFECDGDEIVPADGVLGFEARLRVHRVTLEWTTAAGSTLVAQDLP